MIHTWSDLFVAIKKWFDTPITREDIKNKFKKDPRPTTTQLDAKNLLHTPINRRFIEPYFRYDYNRDRLDIDPYYKNLKRDDSMWEDQIQQEVDDALTKMQDSTDPAARAIHRQELIQKLRQKYGLDHP